MQLANAFFVTRAKSNTRLRRVYSAPVDRDTGIICDQTVALVGYYSSRDYSAHLRRIRFKDPESGKTLVFLTNNFALPAATICALYKAPWQVELFFTTSRSIASIARTIATKLVQSQGLPMLSMCLPMPCQP